MNKMMLFLAAGIVLFSCASEKPGEAMDSLKWLEGTWQNTDEVETISSEQWSRTSPLSFQGIGLTVNDRDTLFIENLQILQEKGYVFYIADVGEGPVKFRLTSRSADRWTFTNPDHDFPKKIIYARVRTGNEVWLHAIAEGNGKQIPFNFKKASK